MLERLTCGDLSTVDFNFDNIKLPSSFKSISRTPNSNKQHRRHHGKQLRGGVKSLTPPRHDTRRRNNIDPLNVVGSDLLITDYPLTLLEGVRQGHRRPRSGGTSDEQQQYDDARDEVEEEERLLHTNLPTPVRSLISRDTINSIRKRGGINEVERSLASSSRSRSSRSSPMMGDTTSTTSWSAANNNSNNNNMSMEEWGKQQEERILRKLHNGSKKCSNNNINNNGYPTCPNCATQLTYHYIKSKVTTETTTTFACATLSSTSQTTLTISNIRETFYHQNGNDDEKSTTRYKLQNLLPPQCNKCHTYFIYDYMMDKYKLKMLENLSVWLEHSNDDTAASASGYLLRSKSNSSTASNGSCKVVVINTTPTSSTNQGGGDDKRNGVQQRQRRQQVIHITTSFNKNKREICTPKCSNSVRTRSVSTSRKFKFDTPKILSNDDGQSLDIDHIFSGISSLTSGMFNVGTNHKNNKDKRHVVVDDDDDDDGEMSDEDPFSDLKEQNKKNDDATANHKDAGIIRLGDDNKSFMSPCLRDRLSYLSYNNKEEDSDVLSSKRRNRRNAVTEQLRVVVPPATPTPRAAQDSSQSMKREEEQYSDGPKMISLAPKISKHNKPPSNGGDSSIYSKVTDIKSIHTEFEEQMILNQYSIKEEIATKQLAKDIIRGRELASMECERCNMPLTKEKIMVGKAEEGKEELVGGDEVVIECTTCSAIQRNAKRKARQKRRKVERRKAGDNTASMNKATNNGQQTIIQPLVSLNDEDIKNLTALEEGILMERRGPPGKPTEAASISDSIDYWVRHSSSQLDKNVEPGVAVAVIQQELQIAASSASGKAIYAPPQPYGSKDEIEYSLSSYQENMNQQQQKGFLLTPDQLQYRQSNSHHHEPGTTEPTICETWLIGNKMYQGSVSEASGNNSSSLVSSSYHTNNDDESSKSLLKPSDESGGDEITLQQEVSAESSTRCPRDLPSGEMIWQQNYDSDSGVCLQSIIAHENDKNNKMQHLLEPSIVGAGYGNSLVHDLEQLSVGAKVNYESRHLSTDDHPPLFGPTKADHLETITGKQSHQDVTAETVDQIQNEDKTEQSELPPLYDGVHKATDGLEQQSKVPQDAGVSCPERSTLVPVEEHLQHDNISERIARLADSLKEVSNQFPKSGIKSNRSNVGANSTQILHQAEDDLKHERNNNHSHHLFEEKLAINLSETLTTDQPSSPIHKLSRLDRSNLRANNGIPISISPINVCTNEKHFDIFNNNKHESAQPDRRRHISPRRQNQADPPGSRDTCVRCDRRDPPDEDSGSSCYGSNIQRPKCTISKKRNESHRRRTMDPPSEESCITASKSSRRLEVTREVVSHKAIRVIEQNLKLLQDESSEIEAIKPSKSWGESSMNELFQQIDEIESDFSSIVASMPESISLKSSSETGQDDTDDKHSLVEITLNKACSFDSNASEASDSILSDVVQRMQRMREYLDRNDSVDDEDNCSDIDDESQTSAMSELMRRLANAAESLREWEDD